MRQPHQHRAWRTNVSIWWIFVIPVVYLLIGSFVLALIDTKHELMHWYDTAPNGLARTTFWLLWPYWAWKYKYEK